MKLNSRPTAHTAFATACFSRTQQVGGRVTAVPASEVHAKMMGTTNTLCGQSALSWFKFWDLPFVTVRDDRCPRCSEVFVQQLEAPAS